MPHIKLIGRNSKLSLVQLQLVQQKIEALQQGHTVEIITKTSQGDELQNIPLHTVEGSDFFTKAIYEALQNGEADIAVHSLKDMSYEHFFSNQIFGVVDRDDVRDLAIFNTNVLDKIKNGLPIVIGTCSPRRELMATSFLQKALPQIGNIQIETKPIRGNVETRLQKLDSGVYDATILATAGLNRLLKTPLYATQIKNLLANKKLMLLPLFECVPAACQGAIVAESIANNTIASNIINEITNTKAHTNCIAEKEMAHLYGSGCNMPFGVATISTQQQTYTFAAGNNIEGNAFSQWTNLPSISTKNIFATTSYMKEFFSYDFSVTTFSIKTPIAFIANYKAITKQTIISTNTTIIASGTKTWLQLAKQGYWVTASADALGFEQIQQVLQMPLFNFSAKDYTIITNIESTERWQQKGFTAIGTYALQPTFNTALQQALATSDAVFWSSYLQFKNYHQFCKQHTIHACGAGETASLLQQQGIQPIIFPTLQSFQQWKQYNIL
jgi:hydroxymethylbilane synthase